MLVDNAGVTTARRGLTGDGVERTFTANVLAPFALTHLLCCCAAAAASSTWRTGCRGAGAYPDNPFDTASLSY